MNRIILPFFLAIFCWTTSSQAQVTIDQSNFLRGSAYLDSTYTADPAGYVTPTEGTDQLWDYSSLMSTGTEFREHFDASGNMDFPEATSSYDFDAGFLAFTIPGIQYERVDENGWFVVANKYEEVTFPISSLTGNPTDSLRFPGFTFLNNPVQEVLPFPLTYQIQWENTILFTTNFELTVAGFGLNKVPGARKSYSTSNREVVGYGNLIIPQSDGTPSAPMEVLLVKVVIDVIDSTFLAGAPAPAALLGAFGLTQGQVSSTTSYNFYRPGFGASLLSIDASDSTLFYRPQAVNSLPQQTTCIGVSEWDEDNNGTVDYKSVTTKTYDANGNLLTATYEDDFDNDGTVDSKDIDRKTYDANGNLLTKIYERDLDTDGIVDYKETTRITYDVNGNELIYIFEEDDDNDGAADRIITETKTYDTNGNVLTKILEEVGSFFGDSKQTTINTYDANGNQVTKEEESDFDLDGIVDFKSKIIFTYDANGNQMTVDSEYDEDNNGTVDSKDRAIKTYDANGNLLTEDRETDFDNDGIVDYKVTIRKTYDANGNLLTEVEESDEDNDGTLDDKFVLTYTYDANGNRLTSVIERSIFNTYKITTTKTYDANGNQLTEVEEFDDDNDGTVDSKSMETTCPPQLIILPASTCPAPAVFTVEQRSPRLTQISWNPIEGVQHYTVQIRFKGMNRWLVTANIKSNKVNVYAPTNKTYEFRVATMCESELSAYSPINEYSTSNLITDFIAQSRSEGNEALESITIRGEDFKVFPNPVSDVLMVQYQLEQRGTLSIYHISGRKVKEIGLNPNIPFHEIDMSQVNEGYYFLEIQEMGKTAVVQKIVKQ